ncbi:penicillin-binding protein activator LpoB [Oscillatoriales cyanobacterium USR001]|nr:penicillin-binding protein activator LpoB [Oscillatoriales cyanobacterium USR001]
MLHLQRFLRISIAALLLTAASLPATLTPAASEPSIRVAQAGQKKRLVVMDFDYGTTNNYYNSYRGVGAAKGISEMLINELVNNGTYTVVDRSKLEQTLRQQNRSGSIDVATAVEIGKELKVDAVLIGTITRFDISKQSGGGGGFLGVGGSSSKTKAIVQIDVRLISTSTGDILAAAKAVGEADQGSTSISVRGISGNSSEGNNDEALLSAAIEKSVNQMVTKLAEISGKIP